MTNITYLGQCTFVLDFNGTRIVTDPHLSSLGPEGMRAYPAPCTLAEAAPDAVIISHSHVDHLDPKTIAPYVAAEGMACFYAPAPECGLLEKLHVQNWRPARAEQSFAVGEITITPIPCAHTELHRDEHGDYRELSYIVSGDGKTIFFGGDMSLYPGLVERLEQEHFDLLLLPVNGRDEERTAHNIIGNLNEHEAAELAAHLKAPYCPMHHDLYAFNGCPVEAVEAAAAQAGATLLQPKLNVPMAI